MHIPEHPLQILNKYSKHSSNLVWPSVIEHNDENKYNAEEIISRGCIMQRHNCGNITTHYTRPLHLYNLQ